MYRYMYQDFSMLCIAAGVFFVLGLIYFFSTPSEETEKKAVSLGISGYTLYRVIAVTYWLCELYFLPVFLARFTGLLWLRHFRLLLIFVPIVYRLKMADRWLHSKEKEAHDHE